MKKVHPVRVLFADDHTLVRQGLRSLLENYPNIEVVGEATNGEEAVLKAENLQPTVVVMDIGMSKMDGITAARLIKAKHPHIAVIGLSDTDKGYEVDAMLKAGACETLTKERVVDELCSAIQRAVTSVHPNPGIEETGPAERLTSGIKELISALDAQVNEAEPRQKIGQDSEDNTRA